MFIGENELAKLRKDYPEGSVIVLDKMDDPYRTIPAGTKGIVDHIDDAGTIFVVWETGLRLGLVYGEDEYHLLEKAGE